MNSKDLLAQLSRIERSLQDFSFDELTAQEAAELKRYFEKFRRKLENKIFQPAANLVDLSSIYDNNGPRTPENTATPEPLMLIAQVSHEIRTPLNGIIGFTDLLMEDTMLNENQVQKVNAIQKASYSLMEIINELLEYSKMSAGYTNFESVHFNLRAVVGDVSFLCKTLISGKEISFETYLDPHIPEVLAGDPSKLTQILLNLLGNAVKFVEKGIIGLKINKISHADGAVLLKFEVYDTGIGISQEHIAHIFDGFRQADANTFYKYGGTGLGLTIVRQVVEKLGGQISVSSHLGEGTSFTFSLPYRLGNAQNLQKNEHCETSSQQLNRLKGLRVLVFEDNEMNQRLMAQRLATWGCKPFITSNAQYGLGILENLDIDLVLMDLRMPVMGGFEITERIRSNAKERIKHIPIIALSADFTALDKELCAANGISHFLLKPYDQNELLSTIIQNSKPMGTTQTRFSNNDHHIAAQEATAVEFNLEQVLEDCLGQIGLLKELVMLYRVNALEFLGAARVHLNNQDFEQLDFAAHKIKAGLKMLHSHALYSIVEQIQKNCKSEPDVKHLEFLVNCFTAEYPSVEREINAAMENLEKQ